MISRYVKTLAGGDDRLGPEGLRSLLEAGGRSEFSYGSFIRSIPLPPGANEDDIKATYDKGILTVSVAVSETAPPAEKHVAVEGAK